MLALLPVSALMVSACAPTRQAAGNADALLTFGAVCGSREDLATPELRTQNAL